MYTRRRADAEDRIGGIFVVARKQGSHCTDLILSERHVGDEVMGVVKYVERIVQLPGQCSRWLLYSYSKKELCFMESRAAASPAPHIQETEADKFCFESFNPSILQSSSSECIITLPH